MKERLEKWPEKVVDLTSSGWNSRLGRYYIGQTRKLYLSNQLKSWAGIINPYHSGINVYFDIFTITNFGEHSFNAEILLNAEIFYGNTELSSITPSNQSIIPAPKPKAYMVQTDCPGDTITGGINIFNRIVPPNETLVSDSHQGSIIIGPGRTFSILLSTLEREINTATIVLTWWEERI